jgi:hypothetical protein
MPRSQLKPTLMSSTAHRWNCGRSARGRPRSRAITLTGNGNVSSRTSSAEPRSMTASRCSSTIGRTASFSQRSIVLRLNACCTSPRYVWCSGSSISRMVWPMTSPITAAYPADENVSPSRSTCCTASKEYAVKTRWTISGASSAPSRPIDSRTLSSTTGACWRARAKSG